MLAGLFPPERKEKLARFVLAFAARFGSTVLSFLVLFVASRLLPALQYGLYVFLFSVGSALGLIAVFGQQILIVKHYRRTPSGSHSANQALIRVNRNWMLLGNSVLIVAALVLWVFDDLLVSPYNALPIAFLFAAIFALSEYLQNYFRIHGRIALS